MPPRKSFRLVTFQKLRPCQIPHGVLSASADRGEEGNLVFDATKRRAEAVAAVLRELLGTRPRYRRKWQRWVMRSRSGISRAAVARVIESYLVESGEAADDGPSSRQLKDRVSRALNGDFVSLATIDLFIRAFDMTAEDAGRLCAMFSVVTYVDRGISGTLRRRRELVRPQDHRTVNIVERYVVGADRCLTGRRTQQTIRATADQVGIYMFNHETSASAVEVIHGGRLGRRYQYGGGLVAVEIVLDRPLARDEDRAFEYRTIFADGDEASEVRRPAFVKAEHVDFAVEFAEQRMPRAAWWCGWDDHLGGRTVFEEPVRLEQRAIRKYVPFVEESVVGFRWVW